MICCRPGPPQARTFRLMPRLSREFGRRVRQFREAEGLSQERLADKAGLHKNYVGAVERGEINLSLENAGKLAKALGVHLSDLVRELPTLGRTNEGDALRSSIMKLLQRQSVPRLKSLLAVVREFTKSRS